MKNSIPFNAQSWIDIPSQSDFSLQNIPFGIATINGSTRVVSRIGDHIIDIKAIVDAGQLDVEGLDESTLASNTLNDFIAQGKKVTTAVRLEIMRLFEESDPGGLKGNHASILLNPSSVEMLLPLDIGDYTDFYSSREHATNVGTMFRDPNNALLPNWLHIPVGYHGRASSIVVSGTDIKRPSGQTRPDPEKPPIYGPCKLMDFELEMAFVVGKGNELGEPISTEDAEDHIFGLALFNDWSARDIQKWEYVPLGPFLGKNFASTISPWIVTLEALDPFRIENQEQDPEVLPYLKTTGKRRFDIPLEVDLTTSEGETVTISRSNFKFMYWSMVQQLAHHTINGCNMQVGDVCASGTISGTTPDSYGSMLELSWRGTKPLSMPDGSVRKFLQNGDSITLRGFGEKDGVRVGFGECTGKII